jgi:hypothetical protein
MAVVVSRLCSEARLVRAILRNSLITRGALSRLPVGQSKQFANLGKSGFCFVCRWSEPSIGVGNVVEDWCRLLRSSACGRPTGVGGLIEQHGGGGILMRDVVVRLSSGVNRVLDRFMSDGCDKVQRSARTCSRFAVLLRLCCV